MLRLATEFKEFKLHARDGYIGKAREFYFDDRHWTVRYLVADTGDWWTDSKQVLISPYALSPADEAEKVLPVSLTKRQIMDCPPLASDQPVSRHYEDQYYRHYGWPYYGYGSNSWGVYSYPVRDQEAWKADISREEAWDPNLRSTHDVTGHHIQALDGEIGHVADFIIDDETWAIRYLVVDTSNWWAGRHVLVSPQWIDRVSWGEKKVFINLSCEKIKQSKAYLAGFPDRDYETELYRHYDRDDYWTKDLATKGR